MHIHTCASTYSLALLIASWRSKTRRELSKSHIETNWLDWNWQTRPFTDLWPELLIWANDSGPESGRWKGKSSKVLSSNGSDTVRIVPNKALRCKQLRWNVSWWFLLPPSPPPLPSPAHVTPGGSLFISWQRKRGLTLKDVSCITYRNQFWVDRHEGYSQIHNYIPTNHGLWSMAGWSATWRYVTQSWGWRNLGDGYAAKPEWANPKIFVLTCR